MSTFSIISKKHGDGATTEDYNSGKATIGTGKFRFIEWVPGDRLILERNENYWGEKPEWKRIVIKPIKSSPARVAALLAGDVDFDFVGHGLFSYGGLFDGGSRRHRGQFVLF